MKAIGGVFRRPGAQLAGLLFLALLWNMILTPCRGYEFDVNTHIHWTQLLLANGITGFFPKSAGCDYFPGYLYVLWIVGHLYAAVRGSPLNTDILFRCVIKIPAILGSLLIGLLIYEVVRKRSNEQKALWACAFYLFNPAVWLSGPLWGQVDSVPIAMAVGACVALLSGRWILSALLTGAACATKPQIAMQLPAIGYMAWNLCPPRHRWRYAALATGAFVLTWIPFVARFGVHAPLWAVDHIRGIANEYPFASCGGFGVWTWVGLYEPDTVAIAKLSAASWGLLMCGVAWGLIYGLSLKSRKSPIPYFSIAFLTTFSAFLFWTRMHERYACYAIPFALLAWTESKDKRWGFVYWGVSIVCTLNLSYVLYTTYGNPHNYILYDRLMPLFNEEWLVLAASSSYLILLLLAFSAYARGQSGGRQSENT